jgi:hypothetical protein
MRPDKALQQKDPTLRGPAERRVQKLCPGRMLVCTMHCPNTAPKPPYHRCFAYNAGQSQTQWSATYLEVLGDHLQCALEHRLENFRHLRLHLVLELVDDNREQAEDFRIPAFFKPEVLLNFTPVPVLYPRDLSVSILTHYTEKTLDPAMPNKKIFAPLCAAPLHLHISAK